MKLTIPTITALVLPLAAASLLSSCVSDGNVYTSGSGYATYASLPPNYSGTSYYYNNRYYAGGRYETGRYSYGGRTYANRYYYNGKYIYGGDYRQYPASRTSQRQYATPAPTRGSVAVIATAPPRGYSGSTSYRSTRSYPGGRYDTGRSYIGRGGVQGQYSGSGDYRGRYPRSTQRRLSTY